MEYKLYVRSINDVECVYIDCDEYILYASLTISGKTYIYLTIDGKGDDTSQELINSLFSPCPDVGEVLSMLGIKHYVKVPCIVSSVMKCDDLHTLSWKNPNKLIDAFLGLKYQLVETDRLAYLLASLKAYNNSRTLPDYIVEGYILAITIILTNITEFNLEFEANRLQDRVKDLLSQCQQPREGINLPRLAAESLLVSNCDLNLVTRHFESTPTY